MDNSKECKGCSASVRHSFEEINLKMHDFIGTIESDQRVTDELYNKRLAECDSCAGLYYESTCRYCGCFVQMRALRINTGCPHPAGSRWRHL